MLLHVLTLFLFTAECSSTVLTSKIYGLCGDKRAIKSEEGIQDLNNDYSVACGTRTDIMTLPNSQILSLGCWQLGGSYRVRRRNKLFY